MRAGIKTLLQRPALRTFLFVMMIWVFYATRSRPPDLIYDADRFDRYGFLANGRWGLVVLDFYSGDSTQPLTVGETLLEEPKNLGEYNTGAKLNAVQVFGDRIYLANDHQGLVVLSKPNLLATLIPLTGEQKIEGAAEIPRDNIKEDAYQTPGDALDLAVQGNFVYVVDSSADIAIINVKKEIDPDKVVFHDVPGRAQKIQFQNGFIYVTNDEGQFIRYSLDSSKTLLQDEKIFDLATDIQNFRVVGDYAYLALGDQGLKVLNLNADTVENAIVGKTEEKIKAYDVSVNGSYLYLASKDQGLLVVSAKEFSDLVLIGQEKKPSAANLVFNINNNIFVADGKNGLKHFSAPVNFDFSEKQSTINKGVYQDVIVQDNKAFIAAGDAGLQILNVKDPTFPVDLYQTDSTVGEDVATSVEIDGEFLYVTYKKNGLRQFYVEDGNPTDSIWPTEGEANEVMVVGDWAYVANGPEGLKVCHLKDITNGTCYGEDTPGTALGVYVLDDFAYIADDGQGLQIIRISDPERPTLEQTVSTQGEAKAIFVAKRNDRIYAFVANGDQGLFITDLTNPKNPVQVAVLELGSRTNDVKVIGNRVYLTNRAGGLMIVDISTITAPALLSSTPTPGKAPGLFVLEDISYIADDEHGLRVIDMENEKQPIEIGFHDVPKNVQKVVIYGGHGYLVDGDFGMWVLDLSNPNLPSPIAFYATPGQAKDIAVQGDFAYIADGESGVEIVKIDVPEKPVFAGSFEAMGNALSIAVDSTRGDRIYVGTRDKKIHLLNISNKGNIEVIKSFGTAEVPLSLQVYQDYAYVSEGEKGLEIFYVKDPDDIESYRANEDLGLTDTRSVEILRERDHIMVADGKNGMKVFGVRRPFAPKQVYHFSMEPDVGFANSISANGEYAFLSAGDQGVIAFYIGNLGRIHPVGHHSFDPPAKAGAIVSISVIDPGEQKDEEDKKDKELEIRNNRFYTYVSAGELKTLQVDGRAEIRFLGEYETSGEANFLQVGKQLSAALSAKSFDVVQFKVRLRLLYYGFGCFTFILVFLVWLVVFAQFVLPIQTIRGYGRAISRLFLSLWGKDGPAVFVSGGRVIGKPKEKEKDGPGVVRVDLNSAVVLERRFPKNRRGQREYQKLIKAEERKGIIFPRSRVAGSGVKFTFPYEVVRGAADLRPQFRLRPGVKAYTRDGIEFNNPVWVLFTLGQAPETLEVAYEGERKPENLKVVRIDPAKPKPDDPDDVIEPGTKSVGFSDELDPEDRIEIHRHIQTQLLGQFSNRTVQWALELERIAGLDGVDALVKKFNELAENFGIQNQPPIKEFLDELPVLIQINLFDEESAVDWFRYQVIRKAHALGSKGAQILYAQILPDEINFYQESLQAIQDALDILDNNLPIPISRQKNSLRYWKFDADKALQFVSQAVSFRNLAHQLIGEIVGELKDGPVDQALRERWNRYLALLDQITQNLISSTFPDFSVYANMAWMHSCFENAVNDSPLDGLRQISDLQLSFQLWNIRKWAKKIQKNLKRLSRLVPPILDRYPDYIHLEAINRFRVEAFLDLQKNIQVPIREQEKASAHRHNRQVIKVYVAKMKSVNPLLALVEHQDYRDFVRDLQKLIKSLEGDDMIKVTDFSRAADQNWRELERENSKITRLYYRRVARYSARIQNFNYRIEKAIKAAKRHHEVTRYRLWVQMVMDELKKSGVLNLIVRAQTRAESRIGPFLYDRERVMAAVYSEALNKDRYAEETAHMPWTDLPPHVAVQIYRDMVSKEQYDNLYQPNNPNQYNVPKLKGNLARAVRNQGVLAFRFIERFDAENLGEGARLLEKELFKYPKRDLTNPKVLRARGIKVIAAGFPDLFPVHSQVSGQLLDYWRSSWERNSMDRRSQSELQAVRVINQARAQAQRDMAHTLAQILQSSRSDEALAMRVFQALESIAINTDNRQFLPRDTMFLLRSFKRWFLPDGSEDQDEGDLDQLPGNDLPYLEG